MVNIDVVLNQCSKSYIGLKTRFMTLLCTWFICYGFVTVALKPCLMDKSSLSPVYFRRPDFISLVILITFGQLKRGRNVVAYFSMVLSLLRNKPHELCDSNPVLTFLFNRNVLMHQSACKICW